MNAPPARTNRGEWFLTHIVAPIIVGLVLVATAALTKSGPFSKGDETGAESTSSAAPTRTPAPNGISAPAKTTPDPTGEGSVPEVPSECSVTISFAFAALKQTPDPSDQREVARVPPGTYPVLATRDVQWAGTTLRFLELEVNGKRGWIEDNVIMIDSRSGC